MEVEVKYTGTETERKLAEIEQKAERQKIEIDDEILKKAIEKNIVSFKSGMMERERVIDSNGNCVWGYTTDHVWKYKEYGKIPEIVAEMVRLKKIDEQNENEREIQKQEQEKRQKEVETEKQAARDLIGDEITALTATIKRLEADLRKYKDTVESRRKQAEEREVQEKIRKIEAKGLTQIEWDSEKYKEVDEYFDDYETLERVRLIDEGASQESWRERDTEETICVYSAAEKYFVEG